MDVQRAQQAIIIRIIAEFMRELNGEGHDMGAVYNAEKALLEKLEVQGF